MSNIIIVLPLTSTHISAKKCWEETKRFIWVLNVNLFSSLFCLKMFDFSRETPVTQGCERANNPDANMGLLGENLESDQGSLGVNTSFQWCICWHHFGFLFNNEFFSADHFTSWAGASWTWSENNQARDL